MSKLDEIKIADLLGEKFIIPSYQRGYRWTERQVEDLLDDISNFKPKNDEWYCLQPVVVKKNDSKYIVLDGQQRLTTIYLILKYLQNDKNPLEIEYQTRNTEETNSKDFLENIESKSEQDSQSNIDYFHLYKAFLKIKNWFKEWEGQVPDNSKEKFIDTFLKKTKVIWYEVETEKDAIEIFTRINMGKIPLTNAELIKALFLNSSNFKNSNLEEIRLRQLEIASEWDRIEYALQNDELWYFICKSESKFPTRIEIILDFIFQLEKKQTEKINFDEKYVNDEYRKFRFFTEKFITNTKEVIDENWKEIKRTFQIIEEWFTDRELYHKVGFLIAVEEKIIIELLTKAKEKTKKKFKDCLDLLIKEKIQFCKIDDSKYGDDNRLIHNILLLHNIETLQKFTDSSSRFPFYYYKKYNWDIEHVHAIATEAPTSKEHRIDLLNETLDFIEDNDLKELINDFEKDYDNTLNPQVILKNKREALKKR